MKHRQNIKGSEESYWHLSLGLSLSGFLVGSGVLLCGRALIPLDATLMQLQIILCPVNLFGFPSGLEMTVNPCHC